MTTLKEIAKACNVTVSTVSNVLNGKPKVSEKKRREILEVVKQTGYQPNYFAQGIRKSSTRVIGIIAEDLLEYTTGVMVETIMARCEEQQYRTVLLNMRMYNKWGNTWYDDEEKLQSVLQPMLQQLLSIKVDGILYVAGHCRKIHCFPEDLHIPGLMVYGLSDNPDTPSIILDDEKGAYDIMQFLFSKGYERIGLITGVLQNIHCMERLKGIRRAYRESGKEFEEALAEEGSWSRKSGYEHTGILLEKGVDCIFCMNDLMAAGVYDYFYEHQIPVGERTAVMGYDNRELSTYVRPFLSTYDLNLRTIATRATDMMVEHLRQHTDWEQNMIEKVAGNIVSREST